MVEDRLQLENELDLMTTLIDRCRGQVITFMPHIQLDLTLSTTLRGA